MPSTETKTGYIYILHNPSLRDETLKIGITTRTPYIRAAELSRKITYVLRNFPEKQG